MNEKLKKLSPARLVRTPRLRVLLVEGSPADADLVVHELTKAGFDVAADVARTREEVTERLRSASYDIVLTDYRLPGWTGIDALAELRRQAIDIPLILVTGSLGEERAVECLKQGAADYVLKDGVARLPFAVRRALNEAALKVERNDAEGARGQSEQRFRAMIEHSQDGITLIGADATVLYDSPSVTRVMGYAPGERVGRKVWEFAHPDECQTFIEHFTTLVEQPGAVAVFQGRFRHKDGSWRWLEGVRTNLITEPSIQGIVVNYRDVTERRRTEDDLRLFRTLIDQSNDAVEVVDPETGRFLDFNEKACLDSGYSRDELLSLSVFDIDPTVDQFSFERASEELRKSGVEMWEGIHRRKDGSTFPVEVNIKYVQLDRNYLVTVVCDVTARKRAEEVLRESQRRLEEAERIAHLGGWEWDIERDQGHLSEEAYRILGLERSLHGVDYTSVLPCIHPDDVAAVTAGIQAALAGAAPVEMEYRIVHPKGEVRTCHSRARVLRDTRGRPLRIVGIVQDVTSRREEEAARRLLGAAIEQATDQVIVTDADATIVYVNPAFERTTGYTRAEAIGRNPRMLQSGRHDAAFYSQLWNCLVGKRVWTGTFVNRKKDGTLYEQEGTIFPIADSARQTVNYVAMLRDVTAQRALESRLQQAQKMAAIGRLAGGVAHDFNNILTVILGTTEFLLDGVAPGDAARVGLEEIRAAAQRAADLTRQLLAFSRRQVLEPRVLDLNAVIGSIEKMLRRLIGEDIELRLALQPGLGTVMADPGQLDQVIVNLAVNARDAMPGGGRLTIETADVELDAAYTDLHTPVQPGRYVMLR